MKRDRIAPQPEPADYGDGVTYIECLLLGRLDPLARANAIGLGMRTPCEAAGDGLDEMQRLNFWRALISYMLRIAEESLGPDGREAIVQTLRNIPASRALIEH